MQSGTFFLLFSTPSSLLANQIHMISNTFWPLLWRSPWFIFNGINCHYSCKLIRSIFLCCIKIYMKVPCICKDSLKCFIYLILNSPCFVLLLFVSLLKNQTSLQSHFGKGIYLGGVIPNPAPIWLSLGSLRWHCHHTLTEIKRHCRHGIAF